MGLDGEMRRFTADEVRSVFFLVMFLVWLPDYVIGHNGHAWWKDDDVPLSAGGTIPGRSLGGVCPTAFSCDFSAKSGAELFGVKWMNERGLQGALLVYTKRVFVEPALFSLPGWPSVESALDFLKEEARRDPEVSVRASPLRSLFASVGVAL